MRNTISTLHDLECQYTHERRRGYSTRAIDNAIQIIFNGDICKVSDPWHLGSHDQANKNLFRRILDRLRHEHHSFGDYINVDETKMTISLKNK